jgi:hypothetical protein
LEAAKAAVDRASEEITEAYAAENQRAVTSARKAEQAAVAQVRELQHRLDGAAIRVGRAQAGADTFQAEHARELLDEKESEARTLAENLTRAGHEVVQLHRAYRDMRMDTTRWSRPCPAQRRGPMGLSRRTRGRARYRISGGQPKRHPRSLPRCRRGRG